MSKLPKDFTKVFSANIKLSKTHLHKIGQLGGFLGRLLGPLLKTALPLIKNVLELLVFFIPNAIRNSSNIINIRCSYSKERF